MSRIWKRKVKTKEEIEAELKEIEEQSVLFELEIKLEKSKIAFRDLKLAWLDETVTLDEILNDDSWSICKDISKLRGERNAQKYAERKPHSPR